FTRQRHLYRIGRVARTWPPALKPELVVFEVGRLIDVEIDIDRIERDDRGEQSGAALGALHEVADADEMAADAACDRRLHVGELDIELRRLQRAFGLLFRGMRGLQGLTALVDDLFGDGAGRDQVQRALKVAPGELRLGARIRELAVRLQ